VKKSKDRGAEVKSMPFSVGKWSRLKGAFAEVDIRLPEAMSAGMSQNMCRTVTVVESYRKGL
jgi:hypothetical protein